MGRVWVESILLHKNMTSSNSLPSVSTKKNSKNNHFILIAESIQQSESTMDKLHFINIVFSLNMRTMQIKPPKSFKKHSQYSFRYAKYIKRLKQNLKTPFKLSKTRGSCFKFVTSTETNSVFVLPLNAKYSIQRKEVELVFVLSPLNAKIQHSTLRGKLRCWMLILTLMKFYSTGAPTFSHH